VTGVPEKAIFRSVKVYNKNVFSQCNLPAQIEQVQDEMLYILPLVLIVVKMFLHYKTLYLQNLL